MSTVTTPHHFIANTLQYKSQSQSRLRCVLLLQDNSDKYHIRVTERCPGFEFIEKDVFRLNKTKLTSKEGQGYLIQADGLKIDISPDYAELFETLVRRQSGASGGGSSAQKPVMKSNVPSRQDIMRTKMNPLAVSKKSGDVFASMLPPSSAKKVPPPTATTARESSPIAKRAVTASSPVKSTSPYHATYSKSPITFRGRGASGNDEFMEHLDGQFRNPTPDKDPITSASPFASRIPVRGIAQELELHSSPAKEPPSNRVTKTYGKAAGQLQFASKSDSRQLFDKAVGCVVPPSTPPRKLQKTDDGAARKVFNQPKEEESSSRFHAAANILSDTKVIDERKPLPAARKPSLFDTNYKSFMQQHKTNLPPPPPAASFMDEDESSSTPTKSSLPPMPTSGISSLTSFYSKTLPQSKFTSSFTTNPSTSVTTNTSSVFMTKPSILKGGIRNLGNSCYMSTILQALFSLDHTMQFFNSPFWVSLLQKQQQADAANEAQGQTEDNHHTTSSTTSNSQSDVKSLLAEFLSLSRKHNQLRGKYNAIAGDGVDGAVSKIPLKLLDDETILDLRAFKKLMGALNGIFSGFAQQDAHEFLTSLMTHLEEEMKQRASLLMKTPVHSFSTPSKKPMDDFLSPSSISTMPASAVKVRPDDGHDSVFDEDQMKTMTEALKEVVPPVYEFESVMSMKMQCKECQFIHPIRHEKYRDFSLDIPTEEEIENEAETTPSIAVEELINNFLKSEQRELKCPHCPVGNEVKIHKEMTMLPPVLILHLKRFTYSMKTQNLTKSSRAVRFSPVLNLEQCGLTASNQTWSTAEKACKVTELSPQYESLYKRSVDKINSKERLIECAESIQCLYFDLEQRLEDSSHEQQKNHNGNSNKSDYCYKLTGVVRHLGVTLESGHYVCDIYDPKFQPKDDSAKNSHWLRCNDSMVSPVDEEMVLTEMKTPYIFFYQLTKKADL